MNKPSMTMLQFSFVLSQKKEFPEAKNNARADTLRGVKHQDSFYQRFSPDLVS